MKSYYFFLVLFLSSCNYSVQKSEDQPKVEDKCEYEKLIAQQKELQKIIDFIVTQKPILEKITEIDPIEIDSLHRDKIDSLARGLCEEVLNSDLFLKFAFIYANNILYSQLICCVPPVVEVMPPSLIMDDKELKQKDAFTLSMNKLLKFEGVSRQNIMSNGYTHLDMNFPKTFKMFKEDDVIVPLVNEVEKLFKSIDWEE